MEPVFRFKKFNVRHENAAFKVGTDSCLFASWLNVQKTKSILDIGTGSGLIALMLAQRSEALITAVEKHSASFEEAELNFENSTWSSRLQAIQSDFRNWKPSDKFDLIVSNPPYFINAKKSENIERADARHQDETWMKDFLNFANLCLIGDGRIALILPAQEGEVTIKKAEEFGFHLIRKAVLSPNPSKEAHRYLMEFSKTKSSIETEEFFVESSRGDYSPRAKELLVDFLLKL